MIIRRNASRSRGRLIALAAAVALLPLGLPAVAAVPDPITEPHAPDQVIVAFQPGAAAADRAAARSAAGARASERLSPLATDAEVLTLSAGRGVEQAIAALEHNPNVRYAEPNYLLQATSTSDDPYFTNGSLWGMYGDESSPANQYGSAAAEAWALGSTGSRAVAVVVIDEGIQITHPDLAANKWINPGEIAGNKIDDDKNGYVDDINGWDFYSNNASIYDGPGDDHGTHVAGTIGAVGGNGVGVAGVNWNVTLISAKFLGPSGGYTSDAAEALYYARALKTRTAFPVNVVATSNSWGGGGYSKTLLDAINAAGRAGILFVAAAGNDGLDIDVLPSYPAGYTCDAGGWDCVVSVAAINSTGALASWSNYGATRVDLGAPGVGIWSTVPTSSYASYSGTSMATPHVSGAAALCASASKNLRGADLRTALLSTTATPSLAGNTVTGGRLDLDKMAGTCGFGTSQSTQPSIVGFTPTSGPVGTTVTISGTNLAGATGVTFNGISAAFTPGSDTTLTATVPTGATTGRIAVTTSAGTGTSADSFTVDVPAAAVPSAPTGLKATSIKSTSAKLLWTAPATAAPILGYEVTINGKTNITTATQLNVVALSPRTPYTWTVLARNSAGAGPPASSTFRTK